MTERKSLKIQTKWLALAESKHPEFFNDGGSAAYAAECGLFLLAAAPAELLSQITFPPKSPSWQQAGAAVRAEQLRGQPALNPRGAGARNKKRKR